MKKKRSLLDKISRFFRFLYLKLFRINDTPQKIALGFGLGAFLGILPGSGPIASLFLAVIFRVNRASALLGSIVTNTWLSFLTFALALKIGAGIFGVGWRDLQKEWNQFLQDFHFAGLFKMSMFKIIMPVITGYFIIAVCLGLLVYLISLIIIIAVKQKKS